MKQIRIGDRFIDCNFNTHTITEISNDYVFHSYKDGKRVINDGCMLRQVFDKFIKNGCIYIL